MVGQRPVLRPADLQVRGPSAGEGLHQREVLAIGREAEVSAVLIGVEPAAGYRAVCGDGPVSATAQQVEVDRAGR